MATFTKGDDVVTANGPAAAFLLRRGYTLVGPEPHIRTPRPAPEQVSPAEAGESKGAALDDALRAAGLSLSGKADEKRARLEEHLLEQTPPDEKADEDVDAPTDPSQDQQKTDNDDAPEEQS